GCIATRGTGESPLFFGSTHGAVPTTAGEITVQLVCLDLEGVLIPEVWIQFAEATGIPELRVTTREVPDYDVLMKQRLKILDAHGQRLTQIQDVWGRTEPHVGAIDFVAALRTRSPGVIPTVTSAHHGSHL